MSYIYPIDCQELMQGQKLQRSSIEVSVLRHIYLILMTNIGGFRYDENYGCSLWQQDFDIHVTQSNWASEMVISLTKNVLDNEPRLKQDFKLEVKIERDESDVNLKQHFIISLTNLVLIETNENIRDIEYSIMFSPITI